MSTLSNGQNIYEFAFGDPIVTSRHRNLFYQEKENKNDKMHFLIEQFYNTDVFSWQIFNSTLCSTLLTMFMFYKWMVQYFLDWDKIEGANDS